MALNIKKRQEKTSKPQFPYIPNTIIISNNEQKLNINKTQSLTRYDPYRVTRAETREEIGEINAVVNKLFIYVGRGPHFHGKVKKICTGIYRAQIRFDGIMSLLRNCARRRRHLKINKSDVDTSWRKSKPRLTLGITGRLGVLLVSLAI